MINRLLFAALPLTLMGCTTPATSADQLTGTSWQFETIDGQPAKSPRAELSFTADRIGANVGCNGMGGAWKIAKDRIVAEQFISTMMYCDGLMDHERAVADLFGAGPKYVIAGDRLTLEGGTHRAQLRRKR